jgi:hypothetical protein
VTPYAVPLRVSLDFSLFASPTLLLGTRSLGCTCFRFLQQHHEAAKLLQERGLHCTAATSQTHTTCPTLALTTTSAMLPMLLPTVQQYQEAAKLLQERGLHCCYHTHMQHAHSCISTRFNPPLFCLCSSLQQYHEAGKLLQGRGLHHHSCSTVNLLYSMPASITLTIVLLPFFCHVCSNAMRLPSCCRSAGYIALQCC